MIDHWRLQPSTLFRLSPIIPVIIIQDLAHAIPLARALLTAGITIMEVTLRTPVALEAIQLIKNEFKEIVIGAGTVLNHGHLQQCYDVGADFAISPGATSSLLQAGIDSLLPLIPGVASISEVMEAMNMGYRYFKLFPAESVGGINWLKSIAGPFPELRFCPTGGINEKNYLDYLILSNVDCVGGSWIVPESIISQHDWQSVTKLGIQTLSSISDRSLDHSK